MRIFALTISTSNILNFFDKNVRPAITKLFPANEITKLDRSLSKLVHIYIYIYIYREREREREGVMN